jgi:hypothetical protein
MSAAPMTEGLGLRTKRRRTCERCRTVFETTKANARYCSVDCLRASPSRYGRSYGQYAPRALGETRS